MTNAKRRTKRVRAATPSRKASPSAIVTPELHLRQAASDGPVAPVPRGLPHRHTIVFTSGADAADGWMATALFAMLADRERAQPVLAADVANTRLLSEAVAALRESECDASAVVVRKPSVALFATADLVVTIGTTYRRDLLAATPQHRREHWLIPGPLGADMSDRARVSRDLIRSRVAMLVCIEGWGRADLSRDTARVTLPRRTAEMLASL